MLGSVTDSADRLIAMIDARSSVLGSEHRRDLAEDHAVYLANQPVSLGCRQEAAGSDQAAVRTVGESQQRLVVGDRAVRERDDRLKVKDEAVLSHGRAQACEPRAPVQPGRRVEAPSGTVPDGPCRRE